MHALSYGNKMSLVIYKLKCQNITYSSKLDDFVEADSVKSYMHGMTDKEVV